MNDNKVKIPEIKLDEIKDAKITPEVNFSQNSEPAVKVKPAKIKVNKKIAAIVLAIAAIILVSTLVPGFLVYNKARILVADAKAIRDSFSKQDINLIENDVKKLKSDLSSFQSTYNLLSWMKIIPVIGNYWNDGNHAVKGGLAGIEAAEVGIETSKPYADIIGFTAGGKKAASGEENANDRIQFIVSTIKDILPKVDLVSQK